MEHIQQAVVGLIDHYGYAGLFITIALGNFGVPIGSEIVLPAAGALTATGHLPAIWMTVLVALAGELTGGSVGYAIGRFGGVPLIERYGRYIHFTHERLIASPSLLRAMGKFRDFRLPFLAVHARHLGNPRGNRRDGSGPLLSLDAPGIADFLYVLDSDRVTRSANTSTPSSRCSIGADTQCSPLR